MLKRLRIQNLAIVPELTMELRQGFNILTGETGAGKSILIDALSLLAGGRASAEDIRHGMDKAIVEGTILVKESPELKALVEEVGLEWDAEWVIHRSISSDSKNKVLINGWQTSVKTLQALSPFWIDISSQHAQQELLDETAHRVYLDAFIEDKSFVDEYEKKFDQVHALEVKLNELRRRMIETEKQRDFLEFQCKELSQADLYVGEEEELTSKFQRLTHGEKLAKIFAQVEEIMSGDQGVLRGLDETERLLREAGRMDESLVSWVNELATLIESGREISKLVSKYTQSFDLDGEEIESMNQRIALLQRLKRKYGSIETAIQTFEEAKSKLSSLDQFEDEESHLIEERESEAKILEKLGLELSKIRQQTASTFSKKITDELQKLGMPKAKISVNISPRKDGSFQIGDRYYQRDGVDDVVFLFAPNPGEGNRPLSKIASGGELSRVLLAIKSVALASEAAQGMCYLFDEVDTGIGGEVADQVGKQLKGLAKNRQVLAVTHLAQIAAHGDWHFQVEKKTESGRTRSTVVELNPTERRNELARMIGGKEITEKTREFAQEMMERAYLNTKRESNTGDPHVMSGSSEPVRAKKAPLTAR